MDWLKLRYVRLTLALAAGSFLLAGLYAGIALLNTWALLSGALLCSLFVFPDVLPTLIKRIQLTKEGLTVDMASLPGAPPDAERLKELEVKASQQEAVGAADDEESRLFLAELRTVGVRLRNEGTNLADEEAFQSWEVKVDIWSVAAEKAVSAIDKADAEWFRTLDVVPPPRLPLATYVSVEHAKAYRELDFRLHRLDRLVSRYSEVASQRKVNGYARPDPCARRALMGAGPSTPNSRRS